MAHAAATAASGASSRPRLLALHGWRTSAAVLQQQVLLRMSGLHTALHEAAEVACLEAPHAARGPPTPDVQRFFQPPFSEWWDAVKDANGSISYVGAEQSLAVVEVELRTAAAAGRPVAGLLGFSQGAALAALVLALQERGERFQDVPPLRCALLISGSIVRDPAFAHLYGSAHDAARQPPTATSESQDQRQVAEAGAQARQLLQPHQREQLPGSQRAESLPQRPPVLRRPTCHLVGDADVMRVRSEQLAAVFEAPLLLRHTQGHVVPRLPSEQAERVVAFLQHHLQPPQ
ncbi:hypothetical protein TSOC_003649 [Tetrabaena socialis]|uniref:Serine hydrolase domain-containing protein n=1 Tax=Tetrabaena socialis TaxID=47790 RepID=A0A2J8AAW7_9CHLO|nr:hypothetical protein TSOC_003649 [Tetrabaena socialis]|eukprot:PNH09666.1 hypothetical protein TSOC_003649 [Tetrabaena socialis]